MTIAFRWGSRNLKSLRRTALFAIFSYFSEDLQTERRMAERKIVDSHFHIFDLEVRKSFPNQNPSHGFPSDQQPEINRSPFKQKLSHPAKYLMKRNLCRQVSYDRGGWPGDGW